jgi:hypothetical protein
MLESVKSLIASDNSCYFLHADMSLLTTSAKYK